MRIPLNWLNLYVKLPDNKSLLFDRLTLAGHMLDKKESIDGNTVIDLELRGNRADCYSIIGIAREVSAIFNLPLKIPEIENKINKTSKISEISLKTKSDYVQRVMMVSIDNIKVQESPKWLKDKLRQYGIPSINNIVDLTNYVMVETGQPMHAFDSERIGSDLEIRLANKGEKITTFLDQVIELDDDDLVWSNSESVLSIAGAIGGKYHSINNSTKKVLLEAASYNQSNIRRTVHRHNLLTDAGLRHEKLLDPNLVEFAIRRYLYLMVKNGWGTVREAIYDYYPKPVSPWKLSLYFKYLTSLSGFEIDKSRVIDILKHLDFKILKESNESLVVLCPTYRTDVVVEEDLIEEILRIQGYESIPENILSLEIPQDITPNYINQEESIKRIIFSLGFDEIISIPFVDPDLQKYNKLLTGKASPVIIVNRPSPEIEEMRMTMLPNLIKFSQKIMNERGDKSRLFEVGKIYLSKDNKYLEKRVLGMSFWNKDGNKFRLFRGYLDSFFNLININKPRFIPYEISLITNSFQIHSDNKCIGVGGEVSGIHFAEFYLDEMLTVIDNNRVDLWPKYPPQIEDLTIEIPDGIMVGDIISLIKNSSSFVLSTELRDIYKLNYTFRVYYQNPERTLNDTEIKVVRDEITRQLMKKYNVALEK